MFFNLSLSFVAIIILVVFFLANAIRILNEYERGVIFRLGRIIQAKGPGLILLIPILDRMQQSEPADNRPGDAPPRTLSRKIMFL